jgi:hypothetical protein
MRQLLMTLALLTLLAGRSAAQCPGMTTPQVPFAKEPLTVASTALALTAAIYKPAGVIPTLAMVSVEGAAIRYEVVGAPTSTTGHPISPLQTFPICGLDSIAAFKAISQGSPAQLFITYYKSR